MKKDFLQSDDIILNKSKTISSDLDQPHISEKDIEEPECLKSTEETFKSRSSIRNKKMINEESTYSLKKKVSFSKRKTIFVYLKDSNIKIS